MVRNGGEIRVLHIDDEPDFARLTARYLEKEDDRLSVQTATTAREGIDLLSDEIDCVISDYMMPDMTGLDVFETVREQYPELPFILFTDTGTEKVASRAISAGVTDYLIKDAIAEQYALLATKIITCVERRWAAQQSDELQRKLHELAAHSEDVLWMFSADWSELLFINSAYEDLFGQSTEIIKDHPDAFLAAIHPADRERVQMTMERVSNGGSERIEYRIETGSEEKWVESYANSVIEDGSVVRVAGFTQDITDQKQWEKEIREKSEQLDRFASLVAHDLRNPWNVANGFLDLARKDHDSDDLATVSEALGRMDEIISDLLTLARAGTTIKARTPVTLSELATSCWDAVSYPQASLQTETTMVISGDRGRLAHVFENLFRNSVEHSSTSSRPQADDAIEHGGESVTVTVGTLATGSGFYIEDDGQGIPLEKREAVFESGYSTGKKGTGFGLSIAKEVVEAHGWDVSITESAEGGVRFEITNVDPIHG